MNFTSIKKEYLTLLGEKNPSEWEKIIANETTDRELIFKLYKQLTLLNTRKTNNPIKKWAENLNRLSPTKT